MRRRVFRFFTLWTGLLLLTGCVTAQQPLDSTPVDSAGAASTEPREKAEPASIKAPVAKPDKGGGTKTVAVRTPPPKPRLSAKEKDPARLLDLARDELTELLGPPVYVRREMVALVWQYRSQHCVLDLFLYQDPDKYRVLDFEVRVPPGPGVSTPECLEIFLLKQIEAHAGETRRG